MADRAQLEQELAAARELLAKLTTCEKIYNRINAATEIENILDVITTAAAQLTLCEAGSLMLLDPKKEFLYFKIAQGDKSSPLKEMRVAVGEGVAGKVAQTGERLLVDAVAESGYRARQFDEKTGFVSRGILCVPVKLRDEIIGVLEVLNKLDGGKFSDQDIGILERLATAAAIAINKAKLLLAAQRQYQNMKLIHEVNTLVTSTLMLDEVLHKLVDAIARAMNVTRCSVMLVEGNKLRVRAAVGMPDAIIEQAEVRLGEGIAGKVALEGRPAVVPDIEADEAFARPNDYDRYRNKSFICVPIRGKGKPFGVLNISNPAADAPFHRGHAELMEGLAAQAAIAIGNARLYRELEQISNLNNSILNSTQNGIAAVGANDAIIFANRALGEIFALNSDSLVGEPLAALGKLFADPAFPELVAATQGGADSPPPREFTVLVGEARRILAVAATPLAGPDGGASGALLVIADETRERELANHLKQAERLAALGQLAAGIAHEIRNPLNLIRGFAQLIQRKAPDDAVIAGNSGIIVQEVDRLNDLVQGMLDLARQEKLDCRPVRLHDQLDRVINLFCEDDTYAMPVELDEGDHALKVLLDEKKMTGVWLNLLRNAGDAMQGRPGGIRLSYGIDPDDPRRVFVSVSDAGCGIPENELKMLFTPFHTTKSSGTGLGLAITHKLVEAHGGQISATSEVARGTTFTVKLPRA